MFVTIVTLRQCSVNTLLYRPSTKPEPRLQKASIGLVLNHKRSTYKFILQVKYGIRIYI